MGDGEQDKIIAAINRGRDIIAERNTAGNEGTDESEAAKEEDAALYFNERLSLDIKACAELYRFSLIEASMPAINVEQVDIQGAPIIKLSMFEGHGQSVECRLKRDRFTIKASYFRVAGPLNTSLIEVLKDFDYPVEGCRVESFVLDLIETFNGLQ